MSPLHSRAAACGLMKNDYGWSTERELVIWQRPSGKWAVHITDLQGDFNDPLVSATPHPTEDAALAVVVEFLEAKALAPSSSPVADNRKKWDALKGADALLAEGTSFLAGPPEAGHPAPCPEDASHRTVPCGVCGLSVCTEECALNAGSEMSDGRWACSAEHWEQMASEKDPPNLHVHHTPAAVERWEVRMWTLTTMEPGWEPFAMAEFGVWCRRRLPAGVARG